MKERDLTYLKHIQDSIQKIQKYLREVDYSEFKEQTQLQDAVVRQMEIIGEAAKQVSQETRKRHPEIAWKEMAGMRDKLIHGYFQVDLDTVWKTYEKEIPKLKTQIERIIKEK